MGVYLWTDEWSPGVNTVAYYPLNSTTTVNDQSGKGKNMTQSGTVTYGTNGGVDCAYFNGGYLYLNESLVLGANPRTISCWFNRQNTPSQGGAFWGMGTASSTNGITSYIHGNAPATGGFGYGNRSIDLYYSPNVSVNQNVWQLLTFTYDGTDTKLYVNGSYLGTPVISGSGTATTAMTLNLTSGKTTICQMPNFGAAAWKGYMSEFIFENKTWTATEISNYYNGTKANYGIS